MESLVDKTIAERYHCIEKIGAGGMGVVYLAEDALLQREVVLKTIILTAREEKAAKRFFREAKLLSQLNHPHIVTIHDFGKWQGIMYIILEYLKGKTLQKIIFDGAPLPTSWIMNTLSQIMDALEAAHNIGIIHRDLKPANIFCLSRPDQEDYIKILDFGTAISLNKDSHEQITTVGEVVGTPHYMSPEQIMGKEDISPASDIYSIGVILYEILSGEPPFYGENTMSILLEHLYKTPEPLDIEMAEDDPQRRRLQEVVETCLKKNPEDRLDSIPALRKAMTEAPQNSGRNIENLPADRNIRSKQFYTGAVPGPRRPRKDDETFSTKIIRKMQLLVLEAENVPIDHSIVPLLEIAGYSVRCFSLKNGHTDTLKTVNPPDVIVLNRGKDDNLTLMREIGKIETWRKVPFLVCGPENDLDYISKVIEAGVSDYLSHPYDPREIITKIDRLSS